MLTLLVLIALSQDLQLEPIPQYQTPERYLLLNGDGWSFYLDFKYEICGRDDKCWKAFRLGGPKTMHRWIFKSDYDCTPYTPVLKVKGMYYTPDSWLETT